MNPRRPRQLAFALALVMLSVPATVLAHAELDTVTPADGSSIGTPPSEIVMTFTEPLTPAKSSIRLVDNSGKLVAEGSTVDANNPKTMRLAVPPALPLGTYTARWTSASALDGDLDHGTTLFTTGAVGPIPGTPVPSAAASPSAPASIAPSAAPSIGPSVAPSSPQTTPTSSTSDALIPIVAVLIVIAALGLWLIRGRSRAR